MKLSTKGRYGLRALIDLAVYSGQEAVSIQSIAKRQNISDRYLEQLMGKLRRAGLVVSIRGAGGGYRLARPAGEISVGEVLRALEGNLDAVTCPGTEEGPGCEDADLCVTRYVWKRINDSITQAVDTIMIEQLVEESRRIREEKGKVGTQPCGN
ncbi:MAG: Rrf2 family transcriptional regulator [Lachnospiraceae bacterium]|jgi:Rrf2 family iron-sulfur cluster assembly transcriptional regulator|nr:Rrf2 family transcriptional regulator [Lachnospiraceae bacterium]MCI9100709.1 Rrf2 family transcriptional regulator [Lachnospiraceae bacterium]MCI9358581.1 Rrf2 family transcriptional regulator [Lachnospiraceae bacterium]